MSTTLKPEYTAAHGDILLFLNKPFVQQQPLTKPVDFDAIVGGQLSTPARDLLKLATLQRGKLVDILADPKLDMRNLIAAVDAYLPSLWQLTASLQSQEASIKLVKKLEFKWSSALSKKDQQLHTGNVLLFETSFVLTLRALAHRDAARILLETRGGDDGSGEGGEKDIDFSEVSKELRMGAGIFDFMGNDLLARVKAEENTSSGAPPPVLEMNRLVMSSLSALFLADAQRLAIAKAIRNGSSCSIVAKLLLGGAEKYEFATRCLTQIPKQSFDILAPSLLEELGAFPAILRACAANALAQMHWERGEHGMGLGYCLDASKRLGIITMGKGLQATSLQKALTDAIARNLVMEKEYLNDCNLVYFEKPVEAKDLRWPNGSFIIDPVVYELPLAMVVNFSSSETKLTSIQTFWTALWAKPHDYPASGEEALVKASKMSGGKGELPSTLLPEVPLVSAAAEEHVPTPKGMDPKVFASLPIEIQREIAAEHAAS